MKTKRFLGLFIVASVIVSLLIPITAFAEEIQWMKVYVNGIGYGNSTDISVDEMESTIFGSMVKSITVSPNDDVFEAKLYLITIEFEAEEGYIFTEELDVDIYLDSIVENAAYEFVSETTARVSFDVDFTNEIVLDPTEPGVEINESNFPDENLREFVQIFDLRNDNVLTDSEIEAVTNFGAASQNIKDFTGIECFTNINNMNISDNPVEVTPNVSALPNLTHLIYSKAGLNDWDLSAIADRLINLNCSENGITEFDLTGFSNLQRFYAQNNNLDDIDLTGAPNLTEIHLQNNNLTQIDLSPAPLLKILHLEDNKLKSLDISNHLNITSIYVTNNCLTSLDLEAHTKCSWASLRAQTATVDVFSDTFDLSILGNPDKITVLSGGTVTGTVLTATEETVVYEYASGHGNDKLEVTLNINIVDSPALTITVNSDSYGTVKTNISNPMPGEAVTLTTIPQNGYRFEGWVVQSGNPRFLTDNIMIMGDSATQIMAVFVSLSTPESIVMGIKVTDETDMKAYGNYYGIEITLDFTSGAIINAIYDDDVLTNFTFAEISLRTIKNGYILVPKAIGNGNNEKLMLWKSMESMEALCTPVSIYN